MKNSLRAEIDRHVIVTQEMSAEDLFDRLGAFSAQIADLPSSSKDSLLGGAPDEAAPTRFVQVVNDLSRCGVELRETDSEVRHPGHDRLNWRRPLGRPKNLISHPP